MIQGFSHNNNSFLYIITSQFHLRGVGRELSGFVLDAVKLFQSTLTLMYHCLALHCNWQREQQAYMITAEDVADIKLSVNIALIWNDHLQFYIPTYISEVVGALGILSARQVSHGMGLW